MQFIWEVFIKYTAGRDGYTMIFVTVGSQKFQFNRLLKAVDRLCEERLIEEEVFAQTGYSNYEPKYYSYKQFLNHQEFAQVMDKADIMITHGGTGAIIGAVKQGKKVIAVPRLARYQEHVDDHQLQLLEQFSEMNLIQVCLECSKLEEAIDAARKKEFNSYISNTEAIIGSIERYIAGNVEEAYNMDIRLKNFILMPLNILESRKFYFSH